MTIPGWIHCASSLGGLELLECNWKGKCLFARTIFVLFVLAADGLSVERELMC